MLSDVATPVCPDGDVEEVAEAGGAGFDVDPEQLASKMIPASNSDRAAVFLWFNM